MSIDLVLLTSQLREPVFSVEYSCRTLEHCSRSKTLTQQTGCGKTCFTESLLLDHLEGLFVIPPTTIHYCYGAWQDGFRYMKYAGVQFHEGFPTI